MNHFFRQIGLFQMMITHRLLLACLFVLTFQVQEAFTFTITTPITSTTNNAASYKVSGSSLSPIPSIHPIQRNNHLTLHSSTSSSSPQLPFSFGNDSGDGSDEEGLTKDKIAVLLEVTFIEACLQIATGYVDVLKLFLATLKASYDQKITMQELVEAVAEKDVSRNTANRPLVPEEISLRTLWMNLAYLTLEYLYQIENEGDNLEFDSNIDDALDKSLGVSLTTRGAYKFIVEEKVLRFLGKEVKGSMTPSTPGELDEAAMMAYSLKIIDLMLVVVKEERLANENNSGLDGNGVGPPRPNIPGAF